MSSASRYRLRLYVAGDAPNSARARDNLDRFCQAHLPDRHQIEVVDVLAKPDRALADRILVTPTLLRVAPRPDRRIIGNLSDTEAVLRAASR